MRKCSPTPTTAAAAKKPIILPITIPTSLAPVPLSRLMNSDSKITPIMSSRIAAVIIDVPTFELSLPNSFRAATVMLTEVADSIVP